MALDKWWSECDELHRAWTSPTPSTNDDTKQLVLIRDFSLSSSSASVAPGTTMDSESLLRKILAGDLYYAKLWLICVVLRGVSWDKMAFEQRELAFQAKEAASECLNTFLGSPAYRYGRDTCVPHNGAHADNLTLPSFLVPLFDMQSMTVSLRLRSLGSSS